MRLLSFSSLPAFFLTCFYCFGAFAFEKDPSESGAGDPVKRQGETTDEWFVFRGDPKLQGVAKVENLLPKPKQVWKFTLGEGVESSAAIVGGRVFLATIEGSVVALSLDSGAEIWRRKVEDSGFTASPLVHRGVTYIGDDVGKLHTFRSSDGEPGWTYETDSEIRSSANTDGDRILFGSYDNKLHCVGLDGKRLWAIETEGPLHSSPAISDGKTFVTGCDNHFRVVKIADGKETGALNIGSYTAASPAAFGKHVFVGTMSGRVVAIDSTKATEVWSYNSERGSEFKGSCAVVKDRVVVAGKDRMVHCLDPASGKKLWAFSTKASIESSPVIVGRRVFVGGNDGNLYMLDLDSSDPDGRELWKFTSGARIVASPAVARGSLVLSDDEGNVYCFAISSLALRTGDAKVVSPDEERNKP